MLVFDGQIHRGTSGPGLLVIILYINHHSPWLTHRSEASPGKIPTPVHFSFSPGDGATFQDLCTSGACVKHGVYSRLARSAELFSVSSSDSVDEIRMNCVI